MKFKSENEFIKHIIPEILKKLKRKDIQVIAEVPWGHFLNEQFDILLINRKIKAMLCLEFKLNNPKKLESQIMNNRAYTEIRTYGLCFSLGRKRYNYVYHFCGNEKKEETFSTLLDIIENNNNWTYINQSRMSRVYWYGYKGFPKIDIESAGTPGNGDKMIFWQLYKLAIKQLYKETNGGVDYVMAWLLFGRYDLEQTKRYFDIAIKEL
jgi:hypothetical protein